MSFCTKCGAELVEGTAFCPVCGAGQVRGIHNPEPDIIDSELTGSVTEPVYQQQEEQPAPVYQQPVYQQPVYQQPTYQQPVYQQPVYQQPVYQHNTYAPATLSGPAKILSIISMACGLLSLVSCYGGFVPAIAALVLNSIATKKAPGVSNPMARTGKITGIFGIILSVICLIVYVAYCVNLGMDIASDYPYQYM